MSTNIFGFFDIGFTNLISFLELSLLSFFGCFTSSLKDFLILLLEDFSSFGLFFCFTVSFTIFSSTIGSTECSSLAISDIVDHFSQSGSQSSSLFGNSTCGSTVNELLSVEDKSSRRLEARFSSSLLTNSSIESSFINELLASTLSSQFNSLLTSSLSSS